jgi:2-polyprenyl-3-methyl-5-hydroxy-6-metoxy-1,4-benzoquinol methylase
MEKSDLVHSAGHYNANYENFQTDLYAQIRREAFGEDIGQNSWLTAAEQDHFLGWLELFPGKCLLDVACGAGGPLLRIVSETGCSAVGIDVHDHAIETAILLRAERGLTELVEFRAVNAIGRLPFSDAIFDAITCIDAINHFPDRQQVISDWARLLKPGGRLLFTDPITLTGPLTNVEIACRSSAGFYLLVPRGYDECVLAQCGLKVLVCEDATANMANVAEARQMARESKSVPLRKIESDQAYENQQEFLAVAARVAREGRLSRFVYVSEKPCRVSALR